MKALLVALPALAGCNLIFGLDPTSERGVDAAPIADGARPDALPCIAPSDHDEDQDGLADGCDLCPHLQGPHGDFDGDGVGDDCDPSPDTDDDILAFDTFEAAAPVWTAYRGSWAVSADSYVQSDLNAPTSLALGSIALPPEAIVDVGFTLAGSVPQTDASIGVWFYATWSPDNLEPDGFLCEIARVGAAVETRVISWKTSGPAILDSEALAGDPYASGSVYQLRAQRRLVGATPLLLCSARNGVDVTADASGTDVLYDSGQVGLRSTVSAMQVRYVVVIGVDPGD